jgi:hypothetical protein
MDYFQHVVQDYLRSSRTRFVNPQCLIQLDAGKERKGRHWYCDFLTIDFSDRTVYLCEVTFARGLQSLIKRLAAWNAHWPDVRRAIVRDCGVPEDWNVATWLFVPEDYQALIGPRLQRPATTGDQGLAMPNPKITTLESVLPWKYRSWVGTHYNA